MPRGIYERTEQLNDDMSKKLLAAWQRKRERAAIVGQMTAAIRAGDFPRAKALVADLQAFDIGTGMISFIRPGNATIQAQMAEDRNAEARHEPMRGTHSHWHASFGAPSGTDGMHEHRHTHYGDNEHAHNHGGQP